MKIIEPGHEYELDHPERVTKSRLKFRNSETGKEHEGTSNQEVIRALIDRMKYLDAQLPHEANTKILYHLRMALVLHETRALERKVEKEKWLPEEAAVSAADGHFIVESASK